MYHYFDEFIILFFIIALLFFSGAPSIILFFSRPVSLIFFSKVADNFFFNSFSDNGGCVALQQLFWYLTMLGDASPNIHGTDNFMWYLNHERYTVFNVKSKVFTHYKLVAQQRFKPSTFELPGQHI